MKRIFSGIQPTGIPHLGNYLGALKQWTIHAKSSSDIEKNRYIFSIVDLHAITSLSNTQNLNQDTIETATILYSLGISNENSILFVQSAVPQHAELAWLFSSCTYFGELQRMTQWKSKAATHGSNCGLFTYPILQAADIALYNGTLVPVGKDQLQHLELTNTIIRRFNVRYGTSIPIVEPLLGPCTKIMSLKNPLVKMSKSDRSDTSRINLTDSPDDISKKIRKSVTDSIEGVTYDPVTRPGITNLLDIYSVISDTPIDHLVSRYSSTQTSVLKSDLADCIINHLAPFRDRYFNLARDYGHVQEMLNIGNQAARDIAMTNIQNIKQKMNLNY